MAISPKNEYVFGEDQGFHQTLKQRFISYLRNYTIQSQNKLTINTQKLKKCQQRKP